MTLASSNRAALRFIEETTFGETPATPAFKELRYVGESLNYNISNVTSDEIRADRMTSDLVQVQGDASGDLNIELSYDAYDDFLSGLMAADWGSAVTVTATDIDADSAADEFGTVAGDFVADGFVVGQWVEVAGFTNADVNGYYRIATLSASAMGVTPSIPATEAAGNSVTIKGTVIRNGTDLKSYSIQKQLQDVSPNVYFLFNGCRIGQMNLSFDTGSILTGSFSVMGLGATVAESGVAGQTEVAAPTNTPMNAVDNVAQIVIDGVTSTAYFSSLSLSINNNLRAQDAIGSLPHIGIALARLEVTAEVELYFENKTEYEKYLNATSFSISFRTTDGAGNSYVFTLPNCKYESGEVVAGGLDQDIFQRSTIRAIRDATTDCMVQIDKFAA